MQDRTIDSALLALRKQIIRGNLDGLEHVEALLQFRGISMPRVMPAKRPDVARRGHMSLMVIETLSTGPKALPEIASAIGARRPEIDYAAAYQRTGQVLAKLRRKGRVRREGRLWQIIKKTP